MFKNMFKKQKIKISSNKKPKISLKITFIKNILKYFL